jgi:ATP-binding cassette, subfamily F, member 3
VTIVSAQNLAMSYGAQEVFTNLDFALHPGERVALVGPNGQGKTTLLRLIAGEEVPKGGNLFRARAVSLGYLRQEAALSSEGSLWALVHQSFQDLQAQAAKLAELERAMARQLPPAEYEVLMERYGQAQAEFEHAGGYTYELTIKQVLSGLGFVEDEYDRPLAQMSGGEQTRAQLARLLLERPNLLLLDEPTNHLDLAAVEWLENYLSNWTGTLLIVSHDRYFLNKVVDRVWELSADRVELYRGNYAGYVRQRTARLERRRQEYRAQQAFVGREEDYIRRNIAGQNTRQAQGRRKRLERLERLERAVDPRTMKLGLETEIRSGDLVLATHDLVIGFPDGEPLITVPDLTVYRGQRVALIGPNGAGKTTFVKTIMRRLKPRAGRIRFGAAVEVGYFAQVHTDLDPARVVLDELTVVENLTYAEARNFLGRFLFSGDDVYKRVGDLSGGERSRLALAKLALKGANFLVLDEPTNHLDIPSREILEVVLNDFAGTILMISHDRYFVEALASHVWALEGGSVRVVEGGYNAYLVDKSARLDPQNGTGAKEPIRTRSDGGRRQAKAARREAERRARQLAELETAIEGTERRLAELAHALEEASLAQDVARLQELGQEYKATEKKLSQLFNAWMAMEAA